MSFPSRSRVVVQSAKGDGNLLEAAFRLRYLAYLEIGHIAASEARQLFDEWDEHEGAETLVALKDGIPVGTVRVSLSSEPQDFAGLSLRNAFLEDLRSVVPPSASVAEVSRLAVEPDVKLSLDVMSALLKACAAELVVRKIDFLAVAALDEHVRFYEHGLSMRRHSPSRRYYGLAKDGRDLTLLTDSRERLQENLGRSELTRRRFLPSSAEVTKWRDTRALDIDLS